jgi:hypothetical protein
MRLALLRLWVAFMRLLEPFSCEKEAMGYTCRHQMHGNVPECGKWSKVRGYDHAN